MRIARSRPTHPRLLGVLLSALALLALELGAGTADAAPCRGAEKPAYELKLKRAAQATRCLLNRERRSRGLAPLRTNRAQRIAAVGQTKTMLRKRCFSHHCPGEPDLTTRLTRSRYLPCACSWSIGENIAWGSGPLSAPRRIVASWMRSPGHRANILNGRFRHIGVGIGRGSPTGTAAAATYTTTFGSKR